MTKNIDYAKVNRAVTIGRTVHEPKIKVKEADYHRNGISGTGFYVILFDYEHSLGNWVPMLGMVFNPPGIDDDTGNTHTITHQCEVGVVRTDLDTIAFGPNSWRGDDFAPSLYRAIKSFRRQWLAS